MFFLIKFFSEKKRIVLYILKVKMTFKMHRTYIKKIPGFIRKFR